MVNRIIEDYMKPRRLRASTYVRLRGHIVSFVQPDFGPAKSQDRQLGLDMQVLWELLATEWRFDYKGFCDWWFERCLGHQTDRGEDWLVLQRYVLELVQRYFLETDPVVSYFLKYCRHCYLQPRRMPTPGWKKDMITHLKQAQTAAAVQYRNFVFSGNCEPPLHGPENRKLSIEPYFIGLPPKITAGLLRSTLKKKNRSRHQDYAHISLHGNNSIHCGTPRRSRSAPPPGSWFSTRLPWTNTQNCPVYYFLYSPTRPLSELDKLSRRRSLSRTHIRAMFRDPPRWVIEDASPGQPSTPTKHPCTNCAQHTHCTKDCPSNCGYCNSKTHRARNCSLKPANRCKCRPFPQYHAAANCFVPCSRACGSPYPHGHSKHKSAVLCPGRCCMCGVRGHTGRKCSLKRCPCGEQHLTQDCRWKVECPAASCDRYLCPRHCKECGRRKGSRGDFVARTCQSCLRNGTPVSPKAEAPPPPLASSINSGLPTTCREQEK